MNKPWSLLILSLVLVVAAGCRSNYTIVMRNGGRMVAKGKPKLIEKITIKHQDTGKKMTRKVPPHYHFTAVGAKEPTTVPFSKVLRIYPSSDSNHEELYYVPTDYNKPSYWNDRKWNKQPWYKRL